MLHPKGIMYYQVSTPYPKYRLSLYYTLKWACIQIVPTNSIYFCVFLKIGALVRKV